MEDILKYVDTLEGKDNKQAYECFKLLLEESKTSNSLYPYMDKFINMLESKNSFVRNRAIALIAENSRWDEDKRIDEIIDRFLKHINDDKPITSRQCIQALPIIAKYKPELREDIIKSLKYADLSQYKDSMAPLILKDINSSLNEIEKL